MTAPSYPSFPSTTPTPLPAEVGSTSSAVVPTDEKNPWKPVLGVTVAFFAIAIVGAGTVDSDNDTAAAVMGCILLALMVAFVVLFLMALYKTIRKFFR